MKITVNVPKPVELPPKTVTLELGQREYEFLVAFIGGCTLAEKLKLANESTIPLQIYSSFKKFTLDEVNNFLDWQKLSKGVAELRK